MDEHMGRRTVGGLLFTKGGSILLFREENSRRKATSCCTRLGCSSRLFPEKDRQMQQQAKETATPRRSHLFRQSNSKSPQGRTASESSSNNAASTFGETDNGSRRETPGRDLLSRLKERVNASRKRSLSGENSPSSPNGSSTGSSSSSRSISRPLHRPASRTRKGDEGRNAGPVSTHRDPSGNSRRREAEKGDDLLLAAQTTRDRVPAAGFLSGSLLRHRSSLQGGPSSYLDDSLEDSNGYWRFDMEGSEEFEDYYLFNDRHRGMRMDIDDMSYEELLALGERIGTVSTGLSEEAISKGLERSLYVPTPSVSGITRREDGDIKCIICQEEYFAGEEVGKMACKHYYHVTCIHQWLQQKNWCPICKSFASSTKSHHA